MRATAPVTVPVLAVLASCLIAPVAALGELPDVEGATLELVQIVFRHGDRSALVDLPSLPPANWPRGFGQLSDLGMLQHFRLGTYFKRRYIDHYQLIGPEYHPESMYIRSTDVDRTIMSAQSQLAGWFPQTSSVFKEPHILWRPVPVHSLNMPDGLLRPYDKGTCPRFTELEDNHYRRLEWHTKQDETAPDLACQGVGVAAPCNNREFIGGVGKQSGLTELKLGNVWEVSDTLLCRRRHNMTMPDWAGYDATGTAVYDQLRHLEDWDMYELYFGHEERLLTGGTLVKEMLSRIQDKQRGKTPDYKVLLYSAHDTTVAAFLEALNTNHWRAEAPPYASSVAVEFYTLKSGRPAVRVVYKNNTQTDDWNMDGSALLVPGCSDEVCPLDSFIKATAAVTPTNWEAACLRTSDSGDSGTRTRTALAVGVTMVIVVGLICLLVLWRRRYRSALYNFSSGETDRKYFINDDELSDDSDGP
eukprot:m.77653 g.77653  ORF g.77653 m.77653 type:complete len:474 (+) comp14554_c0_seq3:638-2059(+)